MFRRRYYVGSTSVIEDAGSFRREDMRDSLEEAKRLVQADGHARVVVKIVAIVKRQKPLPPPVEVEIAADETFD